jgi:integrase
VLADLTRRAVRVKGKILTAAEDRMIDHQETPLAEQFDAYIMKLEAEGTSPVHRANVRRALDRLAADCRFNRLPDFARESLEKWLVSQEKADMGARTRNTYRAAAVAFCNWCIETGRLVCNPFAKVPKADEDVGQRRQRRALTENELRRLLDVARRRPLLDTMTIRTGKRKGEAVAVLREETRRRLERLGQERALIYKTLVLTGLRKGELASLTVGQLVIDGPMPCLVLYAADEKNRDGSTLPLRADLAADLRQWLADKAKAAQDVPAVAFDPKHRKPGTRPQGEAVGLGGHVLRLPAAGPTLPPDTPIFTVPAGLVRILDRDLALAGIPKRDERGRTVDVHAMRHTFGTLLSKGGVTPRTTQAAMRHSDVNLTMNTYTDPKLLDVAGAMEALPALPLGTGTQGEAVAVSATGTDDLTPSPLVPVFVRKSAEHCTMQSILDTIARETSERQAGESAVANVLPSKHLRPLSFTDNGRNEERETGVEPATSSLGRWTTITKPR